MTLVTIHPPRRHIAEKFTMFQTQATSRVRPPARARALSPVRRRESKREREREGAQGVERAKETKRASRTERESTPPESTDELRGQGRNLTWCDGAKREGDTLARAVSANFGELAKGTGILANRSSAIQNFEVLAKDRVGPSLKDLEAKLRCTHGIATSQSRLLYVTMPPLLVHRFLSIGGTREDTRTHVRQERN